MTQKPNALTLHQLGHLLDPSSHSSIAPPTVTWIEEKEKSNAGTSNVVNGIAELGDGTLRIHFNTPRPYLVLLQYLVAGVSVRRVCLNQHHNGLPPTARAHMHTYIPATGGNHCAALDTIAVPPIGAPACEIDYREIFLAFAALCSVNTDGLQWTDPPVLVGR